METKELLLSESVKVYERLLRHEIKGFPPLFFHPSVRKKRIVQLLVYLVEHQLKWDSFYAYDHLTKEILEKYRLDVLLKYVEESPDRDEKRMIRNLLRMAYPFLPGENEEEIIISIYQEVLDGKRRAFPFRFFSDEKGDERIRVCVKYMVEKLLGWTPEEAAQNLTKNHLKQYKLHSLLNLQFSSIFDLLTFVYPHLTYKHFQIVQ